MIVAILNLSYLIESVVFGLVLLLDFLLIAICQIVSKKRILLFRKCSLFLDFKRC